MWVQIVPLSMEIFQRTYVFFQIKISQAHDYTPISNKESSKLI